MDNQPDEPRQRRLTGTCVKGTLPEHYVANHVENDTAGIQVLCFMMNNMLLTVVEFEKVMPICVTL